MSVKSMFEFKFPAAAREEGLTLAKAIGHDMLPLTGYEGHDVIQDVKDPGHVMVNTQWASQDEANTVLAAYQHDAKIKRVTELIGAAPIGFVADVLVQD